jgi:hypothetical protein
VSYCVTNMEGVILHFAGDKLLGFGN